MPRAVEIWSVMAMMSASEILGPNWRHLEELFDYDVNILSFCKIILLIWLQIYWWTFNTPIFDIYTVHGALGMHFEVVILTWILGIFSLDV